MHHAHSTMHNFSKLKGNSKAKEHYPLENYVNVLIISDDE